jgi:glutamine synthetase
MRMTGVTPALTTDELRDAVEGGSIDSVFVCTPDLYGRLMGKRVPAARFLAGLPAGIEISSAIFVYDAEQNVLEGFPEIGKQNGWADMAALPDVAALRCLPHVPGAALVLADLHWSETRPVEISPREVLRRQVTRAAGLGLIAVAAIEFEFHLFAGSYEAVRRRGYCELEPLHATHQDYAIRDEPVIGALWRAFEVAGIAVDSVKSEMGFGQYEITLAPVSALEAADRAALAKLLTKEIAAQHGLAATFMARLHHQGMGSSGHVHVSVADVAGRNLFDSDASALSTLGRAFIGGVMRRAPEAMLLACPLVNSYRRLDPANFVTAALDYGEGRTVPFRVCGHGQSRNLEYRIPGADVNPYLILAAIIASGLDGIADGSEPFVAGSEQAGAVGDLPSDLAAAIERWTASAWARETFGALVVDTLAVAARHELDLVGCEVTDVELRRGFEWA